MPKSFAKYVVLLLAGFAGEPTVMQKKKVKCSSCGKVIFRRKKMTINKYGTWLPKCNTCKGEDTRSQEYIDRQSERNKELYRTDPEFRQKAIDRAKKRYWDNRPTSHKLTSEDKVLLDSLNSYPVLGPGCLGTSTPTTNWKIIIYKGQKRIKGAVFLERYNTRHKK